MSVVQLVSVSDRAPACAVAEVFCAGVTSLRTEWLYLTSACVICVLFARLPPLTVGWLWLRAGAKWWPYSSRNEHEGKLNMVNIWQEGLCHAVPLHAVIWPVDFAWINSSHTGLKQISLQIQYIWVETVLQPNQTSGFQSGRRTPPLCSLFEVSFYVFNLTFQRTISSVRYHLRLVAVVDMGDIFDT